MPLMSTQVREEYEHMIHGMCWSAGVHHTQRNLDLQALDSSDGHYAVEQGEGVFWNRW